MTSEIMSPVLWLGGMAFVFGGILGYASKIFAVEKDPKVPMLLEVLPGANCGGCGYPGCEALAVAIADGKAKVGACPVGGAEVAAKAGKIMGVTSDDFHKMVAKVMCKGKEENCTYRFHYYGVTDCKEAAIAMGGSKGCQYGCMGLGTCERMCPFDAIHITKDNIAVVDEKKCSACGKCIDACPKEVITMVPASKEVHVQCNSKDKGKDVKTVCTVGCIGCKICVKNCPEDAFVFENNLAKIDDNKCTQCMICVEKCPTKAINAYSTKAVVKNEREF